MTSIRDIRKRLGLTQAEMAALLGCSQGNVSFYEHGQVMPPEVAKRLIRSAAARGVLLTFEDIYGSAFVDEPCDSLAAVQDASGTGAQATCQVHAPHPGPCPPPEPTPEGVQDAAPCSRAAA